MNTQNLIVHIDDSICTITISRPTAMNALDQRTVRELEEVLTQLSFPSVRAIILTGSGDKAFVAGADVTEFSALTSEQARAYSDSGQRVLDRIGLLDMPVIAAVNGFALGGGLELALACDFIYASNNARLGLVEVNLGIIPGFGGIARLSRRVGKAMAAELIMTAAQLTAEEALRIGLVNRIVPQAELLAVAAKTAKTIASKAPLAVAAVKHLLREGEAADLRVANALESTAFGMAFATEDHRIGIETFLLKGKVAPFIGR